MRYKIGMVVLFCLCYFPVAAQHAITFRHIDTGTGLSDNLIKGIISCPDGRIGIRTSSMLNLYNGGAFDYFRQDKGIAYEWKSRCDEQEYVDGQNRIWLKQKHRLQIMDLKTHRFAGDVARIVASYGIRQKLLDFFIDDAKNLWFLTGDGRLSYYDVARKQRVALPPDNDKQRKSYGLPRAIEQQGDTCWIVYSKGLIRQWSYAARKFTGGDARLLGTVNEDSHRLVVKKAPTGGLWLMHHTGLLHYNPSVKEWKEVNSISGLSNFFTCMDVDSRGNVWMGTSKSEIRIVDGKTSGIQSFTGMPLTTGGTLVNDISAIHIDGDGGVWIGTLFQGICYYHPRMLKIDLWHTVPHESHITNESVRCFLEEAQGTLLVGTVNGLYRFYPTTKKIVPVYPELRGKLCMSLFRDSKGRVWVSTFHNGFFSIQNNSVRHYGYNTSIHSDPNPNNGRAVYEDASGQLWVSVYGGIGRLDPASGDIRFLYESHPEIRNIKIGQNFFRTDENTFAVAGEGLFFYNIKTDSIRFLQYADRFKSYGAEFNFIFNDSRALQWLSVDGLKVWDNGKKRLYQLAIDKDRPNQTVSAILEDKKGNMWVSTMNGIARIGVKSENGSYRFSVASFDRMDGAGVQAGRFNTGAALRARDETMYFGGVHGINVFHPGQMAYNQSKHKAILTGLRLFNSPVKENQPYHQRIVLDKPIDQTDTIALDYDENFITLEFAGLNYVNPSKTYFRYRLENYDKQWTEIRADGLGRANYTGVPPGSYRFRVYAANNDRVWADDYAELLIVISPPFWDTSWARLLYVVLFIGAIIAVVGLLNRQNHRKLVRKQELETQRQKEELDQMKLNFFTNISHELRTPLSLIMTPLDLLQKEVGDRQLKDKLASIYRHSKELLSMVNQLLDFRKLEVRGEQLLLSHGDMVEFLENIYTSFKTVADGRQLAFTFRAAGAPVYMFFDRDKMLKVTNNLLSNAFKFTADGGKVQMLVTTHETDGRKWIRLAVSDTGAGIAAQELPRIFERFHQARNQAGNQSGSGIGLYLVREYVSLHGGEVSADSEPGEGSSFYVDLPTDLDGGPANAALPETAGQSQPKASAGQGRKILVVEDNAEFRQFLVTQLSGRYDVIQAGDGEEGEQQALQCGPDLILSDVMMPRMDGIVFCQRLKSNIQTCHIPVILLTARISDDARMSVYSAGADSYMTKPFVYEMLLTRIEKLIEQQERRKALFHTTIEVTPSSVTINSLDEALVQKALQSVEDNMDNPLYGVENLGRDIGLSRGNIYRKLQSITGMTPVDFIRSIRLKRAAQLLRDSALNVTEIADMTGFNTLKYFNKHFKETFGITPTQYRQQEKTKSA